MLEMSQSVSWQVYAAWGILCPINGILDKYFSCDPFNDTVLKYVAE